MQKTYWTTFAVALLLLFISIALLVLIVILSRKGFLNKKWLVSIFFLAIAMLGELYILKPCAKDYEFMRTGCYLEEDATVVEFTYIKQDLDGNGQTQYSKPKFYVEATNEYVVLRCRDVEIGKKYRIRYLPNTKICEVLYCVEETN